MKRDKGDKDIYMVTLGKLICFNPTRKHCDYWWFKHDDIILTVRYI